MNEFNTFGSLLAISNIASQYPEGKDFSEKVQGIANRIASRQYRVAVVGEFKRGKSSLINALLGTQILPTDILPMTAAITNVHYGEKQRILIRYRSGKTEESTVEQLIEYATKYDSQKAERAAMIESIRVEYPSVFCKNHIEIIDTPGLNDEDKMTAITLSVLGEIDTAIIAISAQAPLGITEQELVIKLLSEQGIHHIFFVVTYIDTARRESDKDRIIQTIRKRISENLLQRAENAFRDDERLIKKARHILKEPDILGVSSSQAMEGFLKDDSELLETSRFPALKNRLLAFLTAAQSADAHLNTVDAFRYLRTNIKTWKANRAADLNEQKQQLKDFAGKYDTFMQSGKKRLIRSFQIMDGMLEKEPAQSDSGIKDRLKKIFIKNLSSLRRNSVSSDSIYHVLRASELESAALMEKELKSFEIKVKNAQEDVRAAFISECPDIVTGRINTGHAEYLETQLTKWRRDAKFPVFSWTRQPSDLFRETGRQNIMPDVMSIIENSVSQCRSDFEKYIGSWRLVFLKTFKDISEHGTDAVNIEDALKKTEIELYLLEQQYDTQIKKLSEMENELLNG